MRWRCSRCERRSSRWARPCGRLPASFRQAHGDVPWGKVRHFRNFMVHVYDKIETDPMWDTVQNDLPGLREQVSGLLDRL